jgi:hypothetical protein
MKVTALLIFMFVAGYAAGNLAGLPILRDGEKWLNAPAKHRPNWSDR